jgi:hypothetical protein
LRCYSEIIISPEELSNQDIIQKDILIRQSKDALLMGTVYSVECEAIEGALILIKKININQQTVEEIGYVITNKGGEFAFLVKKKRGIHYQLDVYEPMISSCSATQFEN